MTNDPRQLLRSGCEKLGLSLSEKEQACLIDYCQLLAKWNQRFNLTAVRTVRAMIPRHLLDSLAISPYILGRRILDMGAGAGLPGIPLAVCHPDKQFVLIDSNGKKARFMRQAKQSLGLDNIEIVHERVEAFQTETCFDAVIARAFGSVSQIVTLSSHLLCEDGRYLLMKGHVPETELADVKMEFNVTVERLTAPDLSEERHLIILAKT